MAFVPVPALLQQVVNLLAASTAVGADQTAVQAVRVSAGVCMQVLARYHAKVCVAVKRSLSSPPPPCSPSTKPTNPLTLHCI